ncbi:flagellar biosynthesis protein FliQ [bacterium]|nr:flagellar biosynthesis protein FliQ [bacterium]
MNDVYLGVGHRAVMTALQVGLPILITALAVGFIISIFQAVTSIQEATLTFIPKILAVAMALIILGPWMANTITTFSRDLFSNAWLYVR